MGHMWTTVTPISWELCFLWRAVRDRKFLRLKSALALFMRAVNTLTHERAKLRHVYEFNKTLWQRCSLSLSMTETHLSQFLCSIAQPFRQLKPWRHFHTTQSFSIRNYTIGSFAANLSHCSSDCFRLRSTLSSAKVLILLIRSRNFVFRTESTLGWLMAGRSFSFRWIHDCCLDEAFELFDYILFYSFGSAAAVVSCDFLPHIASSSLLCKQKWSLTLSLFQMECPQWDKLSPNEFQQLQDLASCKSRRCELFD